MTQTSTSSETPDAAPMFPPGRYGRRREPVRRRRWPLPTLILVGLAVLSLIAVKLYFEYGTAQFAPTVLSSNKITNTSITVTFEVAKPGGAAATCTVQAFTFNDTQVGEAQVAVPAGTNVKVTYVLATTARAYIGEVPACQAAQ